MHIYIYLHAFILAQTCIYIYICSSQAPERNTVINMHDQIQTYWKCVVFYLVFGHEMLEISLIWNEKFRPKTLWDANKWSTDPLGSFWFLTEPNLGLELGGCYNIHHRAKVVEPYSSWMCCIKKRAENNRKWIKVLLVSGCICPPFSLYAFIVIKDVIWTFLLIKCIHIYIYIYTYRV